MLAWWECRLSCFRAHQLQVTRSKGLELIKSNEDYLPCILSASVCRPRISASASCYPFLNFICVTGRRFFIREREREWYLFEAWRADYFTTCEWLTTCECRLFILGISVGWMTWNVQSKTFSHTVKSSLRLPRFVAAFFGNQVICYFLPLSEFL